MPDKKSVAAPASARGKQKPAPELGLEKDVVLYSLLDQSLLRLTTRAGATERATLPGLFARWSSGDEVEMAALQAHQQHAWHAFSVQLAALALSRGGSTDPPKDEAAWRALLLGCAAADGAGPEAFALVVGDLSKPAFMQPPVPEGRLDVLKNVHSTPSAELDVLITAKNHDLKMESLSAPSPEDWAIALAVLQTTQGFLGAGNYGIVRMNGGFSSRPCVTYAAATDGGRAFRRDLACLLEERSALISRGYCAKRRLGLVWAEPWDGTQSLGLDELDPFFIEVCRRVRLSFEPGAIRAHRGSSKVARIAAGDLSGNTGDAWTPVLPDGRALTMDEAGFTYARVQDLMFGEWTHGAAGAARLGDGLWVGRVLVRGQGKTGGYHERIIPIPTPVRRLFARAEERGVLGMRAKSWVERAATTRLKVLKPAVLTYLQGGPANLKFDDARAAPALRALDAAIDRVFFPLLFEHAEATPEEADKFFAAKLFELAQRELERAFVSLPTPAARRARAVAHAERVFRGTARKVLEQPPIQVPKSTPSSTEGAAT